MADRHWYHLRPLHHDDPLYCMTGHSAEQWQLHNLLLRHHDLSVSVACNIIPCIVCILCSRRLADQLRFPPHRHGESVVNYFATFRGCINLLQNSRKYWIATRIINTPSKQWIFYLTLSQSTKTQHDTHIYINHQRQWIAIVTHQAPVATPHGRHPP